MKIGVFGDSFAYDKHNATLTWSEMLNEKYEIINYGVAGSNLYWSIEQFLQFKNNFDKIVFIATFPGRLSIPDHIVEHINVPKHIPNIDTAISFLSEWRDGLSPEVINSCISYFKYLDDQNYNEYIHKLMYDDLLTYKNSNVLIIDSALIASISFTEYNTVGLPKDGKIIDVRNCHMAPSNNKLFADKIEHWVETGSFNLDYNKFNYQADEIKQFIYEQK